MKNCPMRKINPRELQKSFFNYVLIFRKLKLCFFTYLPVFLLSQIFPCQILLHIWPIFQKWQFLAILMWIRRIVVPLIWTSQVDPGRYSVTKDRKVSWGTNQVKNSFWGGGDGPLGPSLYNNKIRMSVCLYVCLFICQLHLQI